MAKEKVLSIVIPVYNEGVNLEVILPIIKALAPIKHEVLIVHDTRRDDSLPVIKRLSGSYKGLKAVYNNKGKGVVNAIKSGIEAAEGKFIMFMAADDIGVPLAIRDMLALLEEGCDFVNATRYRYGGKNIGGGLISTPLSWGTNALFRVASGCPLTDPTFGVKMMRTRIARNIRLESRPIGWAVSFEIAIKAILGGWKLGEVPIISLNRLYGGTSSFRAWTWAKEYLRWFIWGWPRLRSARRDRRVRVRIPKKLQRTK